MAMTAQVKAELAGTQSTKSCCRKAEVATTLRFAGGLHIVSGKIVVSGYSQGAMVVHHAFSQGLSASEISGAVMFGDPLKRMAISGLSSDKIKEFCGTADQICGGGGDGGAIGSHLSYGSSAEAAAAFAIQAAGLS